MMLLRFTKAPSAYVTPGDVWLNVEMICGLWTCGEGENPVTIGTTAILCVNGQTTYVSEPLPVAVGRIQAATAQPERLYPVRTPEAPPY